MLILPSLSIAFSFYLRFCAAFTSCSLNRCFHWNEGKSTFNFFIACAHFSTFESISGDERNVILLNNCVPSTIAWKRCKYKCRNSNCVSFGPAPVQREYCFWHTTCVRMCVCMCGKGGVLCSLRLGQKQNIRTVGAHIRHFQRFLDLSQ